jgi:tRNA A37 threonylcarbamoyladenosine biosynthesis protein TsaE
MPSTPPTLLLDGPPATRAAGLALGRALPPRAVVLLSGELGSGKTTLVKAVCEALGVVPAQVTSPTYTLVNIYPAGVSPGQPHPPIPPAPHAGQGGLPVAQAEILDPSLPSGEGSPGVSRAGEEFRAGQRSDENTVAPNIYPVTVYPPSRSVYHVDLYRLETPQALLELDREDWLNPDGVTLIEWPEIAQPLLAGEPVLELALAHVPARPDARRLTVRAASAPYAQALAALRGLGVAPVEPHP